MSAEAPTPRVAEATGRCLKCRQDVPLSEVFRKGGDDGPRVHRVGTSKRDEIGQVCGPVAVAFLFHVVADWHHGNSRGRWRGLLSARIPPEEDYGVLDAWEAGIAESFKLRDRKSGVELVGGEPATVVVESWRPMGAK